MTGRVQSPCRSCGTAEGECNRLWVMRDDSDMGCCESCDHTDDGSRS